MEKNYAFRSRIFNVHEKNGKNDSRDEIENAQETLELVGRDSRLGWEPTMEYVCDARCIQWKIAMTRDSAERIKRP